MIRIYVCERCDCYESSNLGGGWDTDHDCWYCASCTEVFAQISAFDALVEQEYEQSMVEWACYEEAL
jgi:hypothetical protein